jgi:hypothetical protein
MKTDTLSLLKEAVGTDTYYSLLEERARGLNPEAWEAQARATEPNPDLDEAVEETFQQAEELLLADFLNDTLTELARAHCERSYSNPGNNA